MDVISAFLDACCMQGEGEVKASQLYAVYARWASENNEYKMSSTKFGTEMAKKIGRKKTRDGWVYTDVRLGNGEFQV